MSKCENRCRTHLFRVARLSRRRSRGAGRGKGRVRGRSSITDRWVIWYLIYYLTLPKIHTYLRSNFCAAPVVYFFFQENFENFWIFRHEVFLGLVHRLSAQNACCVFSNFCQDLDYVEKDFPKMILKISRFFAARHFWPGASVERQKMHVVPFRLFARTSIMSKKTFPRKF